MLLFVLAGLDFPSMRRIVTLVNEWFSVVQLAESARSVNLDQILALSLSAESGLWHIQVAIRTD